MVSLIVFLKVKGYPLKILLMRTRELLINEKFLFGISAFGIFKMWSLVSGELLVSPLVHSLSLFSFPLVFLSLSVSLFFSCPCCCGLLLASSMAESSRCFRNCSRNSFHRWMLVTGLYPLQGADEVCGEVVVVKSLSYVLLLMVFLFIGVRVFCLFCLSLFGSFYGFLKNC